MIFTNLADFILNKLPDADVSVDLGFFDVLKSIFDWAGFLLPIKTIADILAIIITLMLFRIGISIIKTVLQVLPFL